jgi:hypothetical protein
MAERLLKRNTTLLLPLIPVLFFAGLLITAPAMAETKKSQVIISDFDISPRQVEAGEDFRAIVTLENIGSRPASEIRLSINEGSVSSPFAPYLTPGTIVIAGQLAPGAQTQETFQLGSSSAAVPGINNLFLTVRHQTVVNGVYQDHAYTETIGIPIKAPPPVEVDKPRLTISKAELDPGLVEAGREFSLRLNIKNIGAEKARDIRVAVSRVEGAAGLEVFFPVDTSNTFTLDDLRPNRQRQKALKFTVSPHAQAKIYNLVLEMDYRDQEGQTYTASEVISIPVHKKGRIFLAETGPKLILQGQRTSRTPVPAGESFDLFLDIFNAAEFNAKNIKITLSEEQPGRLQTFSPVKTGNVVFIPELAAKERVTRNFSLIAGKEAASERYNLIIEMTYEDAAGSHYESSGTASVLVKGAEQVWGPELTVVAHLLSVERVETGSSFLLTLKVRNIGDKPAKNAKISLAHLEGTDTLDPFSPLQGSNTLYIERLAAGETVARSIELFVSGEAKSKIYNLVLNFSYQGGETEQTASEIIGIPVIEDRRLKIATFNYPEQVMPGEEFSIYAEYINIGQHPVANLFVTFEGDFTVDYPLYYLGKFDTGSTDTFEVKATIPKPGEYHGRVIFSYTNNFNQERMITKPIRITVEEPPAPAFEEELPAEQEKGFWAWLKRFILALLGLGS